MRFAGTKGATGTIAHNGQTVSIVRKGKAIYFRGNAAFWREIGGSRAVATLRGRWIKTSEANPHFAKLALFTHITSFFAHALQKPQPTEFGNGGVKTYRGKRVIALYETLPPRGTFYVQSAGTPYPVAFVYAGKGHYTLTFGEWNRPVSVKRPEGAVDVSKLRGATVARA